MQNHWNSLRVVFKCYTNEPLTVLHNIDSMCLISRCSFLGVFFLRQRPLCIIRLYEGKRKHCSTALCETILFTLIQ